MLKNLIDCLCCCCTPFSCAAYNTRFREQPCNAVSVPKNCATRAPWGKFKIARASGWTTITPYMASLGIISLAAYIELEAKKKGQGMLHRQLCYRRGRIYTGICLWTHIGKFLWKSIPSLFASKPFFLTKK